MYAGRPDGVVDRTSDGHESAVSVATRGFIDPQPPPQDAGVDAGSDAASDDATQDAEDDAGSEAGLGGYAGAAGAGAGGCARRRGEEAPQDDAGPFRWATQAPNGLPTTQSMSRRVARAGVPKRARLTTAGAYCNMTG